MRGEEMLGEGQNDPLELAGTATDLDDPHERPVARYEALRGVELDRDLLLDALSPSSPLTHETLAFDEVSQDGAHRLRHRGIHQASVSPTFAATMLVSPRLEWERPPPRSSRLPSGRARPKRPSGPVAHADCQLNPKTTRMFSPW